MEKINNDKKIETKKQVPSMKVNKLYSICSAVDRKSTRLNSSHVCQSRMPSSA